MADDVLARVGTTLGLDLVELGAFAVPIDVGRHDAIDVQGLHHRVGALDGVEIVLDIGDRVRHRLSAVHQHALGLAPVLDLEYCRGGTRRVARRRHDPELLAADRHGAHRVIGRVDQDRVVGLRSAEVDIRGAEARPRAQIRERPLGAAVMVSVAVGQIDLLERVGRAQAERQQRLIVEQLEFAGGVAGVHLHQAVGRLDDVLHDVVVADRPDVIEDLRQRNPVLRGRAGASLVVPAAGCDHDAVVVLRQVAVERTRVFRDEWIATSIACGRIEVDVRLGLSGCDAR